jgi:hypothetical protein
MRSNRCVDGGRLSGRSIRWRISAVIVAAATFVVVAAASADAASLASWPAGRRPPTIWADGRPPSVTDPSLALCLRR